MLGAAGVLGHDQEGRWREIAGRFGVDLAIWSIAVVDALDSHRFLFGACMAVPSRALLRLN